MTSLKTGGTFLLTGSIFTTALGSGVLAADVQETSLPAISDINGKIEVFGGWGDADFADSEALGSVAGAISVPLGESFGFQGDLSVANVFGETVVGGTGHLFWRDPNSYLFGAIGGYIDGPDANTLWGGGEAELYLGNISIEAIAGGMDVNGDSANSGDFFASADLAYYATDNLRLALGASSIAGFESGRVKMEWMPAALDMPLTLNAGVNFGEDDLVTAQVGLSLYFGGNNPSKSLIDRHRQDDPRIRSFIVGGSAGDAAVIGVAGEEGGLNCPPGQAPISEIIPGWTGPDYCFPVGT